MHVQCEGFPRAGFLNLGRADAKVGCLESVQGRHVGFNGTISRIGVSSGLASNMEEVSLWKEYTC